MKLNSLSLVYQFTRLFWLLHLAVFVVMCLLVTQYGFNLETMILMVVLIVSMAYATDAIKTISRNYEETCVLISMNKALESDDFQAYLKIVIANRHLKCVKESAQFIDYLLKHKK